MGSNNKDVSPTLKPFGEEPQQPNTSACSKTDRTSPAACTILEEVEEEISREELVPLMAKKQKKKKKKKSKKSKKDDDASGTSGDDCASMDDDDSCGDSMRGCKCNYASDGEDFDDECVCEVPEPLSVRFAITRICEYEDFKTYEVMKSTEKKPKRIPKIIERAFILRAGC